jgi:ABC-type transport system involved in multi-copper enzyme maturation permease subunit
VTPSSTQVFAALAREAVADALRRRIVALIALLALFSLLFVDSFTSCSLRVAQNGEEVALESLAGLGGVLVSVVLGLWTLVLAGVLAADHLAEPLADGSANLLLSRPVSRGAFALSRLAGVLALALGVGAVLLGATGFLLQARQGLPPGALLGAFAACAAGAVTVGALAMTASLALPRSVVALLVFGGVWSLAGIELAARLGATLTGLPGALERFGPPLAGSMLAALSGWLEAAAGHADPLALAMRSIAWAVASAALLVLAFRRVELGR